MNPRVEIEPSSASWPQVEPLLDAVSPSGTEPRGPWGIVVWERAARCILIWDNGTEPVCHVGLHLREATWDGRPVRIGGVGAVATRAEHRRRGFASAAMKKAAQDIKKAGQADFALLFCEPRNFAFYGRLGWRRFEGDVFVEQSHGRVRFEVMASLVLDLRLRPRTGVIDLGGLPW
jgi:aminoglycoside 2'-N-acetyltransferase I